MGVYGHFKLLVPLCFTVVKCLLYNSDIFDAANFDSENMKQHHVYGVFMALKAMNILPQHVDIHKCSLIFSLISNDPFVDKHVRWILYHKNWKPYSDQICHDWNNPKGQCISTEHFISTP